MNIPNYLNTYHNQHTTLPSIKIMRTIPSLKPPQTPDTLNNRHRSLGSQLSPLPVQPPQHRCTVTTRPLPPSHQSLPCPSDGGKRNNRTGASSQSPRDVARRLIWVEDICTNTKEPTRARRARWGTNINGLRRFLKSQVSSKLSRPRLEGIENLVGCAQNFLCITPVPYEEERLNNIHNNRCVS